VIDETFQFGRFNQPGTAKVFDRGLTGKEDGRKQEKEGKQDTPRTVKPSSIHPDLLQHMQQENWNIGTMESWV
jgi:hypothetical protein